MKQAITTKFLGPTNTRGARVKAFACKARPSLTIAWEHALSSEENHRFAAQLLADKLKWTGTLKAGALTGGSIAHVFVD